MGYFCFIPFTKISCPKLRTILLVNIFICNCLGTAIKTYFLLKDYEKTFCFFEKSKAVLLNNQLNGLSANQQLSANVTMQDNKIKKSSLFSKPNITIELLNTFFNKITGNNFSENNKSQLNLIPVNNSNEKRK